jgi:hypothetical protein
MVHRPNFPNAFTINTLGASAFPFGIKYRRSAADVSTLQIFPQSVIDVCDLVTEFALPQLVLFDVGQASVIDQTTWQALALREVAREAAIECQAVDDTTIVLRADRLRPLLDNFSHYELSLFDVSQNWREEDVIGQVLQSRGWQVAKPLLPDLVSSTLFLTCHDDCYLHVEARGADLLKCMMARTLQIYAGTVLYEELHIEQEIADVPIELLETLLAADGNLTILRADTQLNDSTLRIGMSRRAFVFGDLAEYPVETVISYACDGGHWSLSELPKPSAEKP